MSFSIPGVFFGFLLASILNVLFCFIVFTYLDSYTSYELSKASIIIGIFLGITIPSLSNIIPIQNALSKNLRDSLDVSRKNVEPTYEIRVTKTEDYGLSWN